MARLPSILGIDDFPLAELCALRIDGEVHPLGGGWALMDEPDLVGLRAAAAALRGDPGLVIAGRSAAWVHGAELVEPAVAEFCRPVDARTSSRLRTDLVVHELVLGEEEIVAFGPARCTDRERTAFDILRNPQLDDADAVAIAADLYRGDAELFERTAARLASNRRFPYKASVARRFAMIARETAQPSLTR